jgi:hypothetical protein
MIRLVFLFALFFSATIAGVQSANITPRGYTHTPIKILDQKELSFSHIHGVKFAELSDVAYDAKTHTLYAVSDKGILYSFDAKFSQKIDKLRPLRASKLKNKRAKRFKKWKRDSEGLALDGKGKLFISFEGKAKVAWFHKNSPAFARLIRKERIPRVLKDTKNYRSKNKSLEALAWHTRYGLLTATEWPLKKDDKKRQTIYALNGKQWHFKAEPESRSGLVAMEVMDDGNILVLERSYTSLLNPLVITLKKVYIKGCNQGMCKTKVLLKMNSHKGWDVDNFEGLAKVGKHRYVMVSDNGNNFFQKTLLVYFEVVGE